MFNIICNTFGHAVPLRGIFRVYEIERTGDQEFDVDFRMRGTESEVESAR